MHCFTVHLCKNLVGRVHPDITLKTLRSEMGTLLSAERSIDKFNFLKCVGHSLALVSAAGCFFSRQTVEWNNADSLINKFTIQAGETKGCKACVCEREHTVFFTAMLITTITLSLLLQVKSKQEGDLKVKTFAPPYVCTIQICICVDFFFSLSSWVSLGIDFIHQQTIIHNKKIGI